VVSFQLSSIDSLRMPANGQHALLRFANEKAASVGLTKPFTAE